MYPHFSHNGTSVTAGQALDAWFAHNECTDAVDMYERAHLFADAIYGHIGPIDALRRAGIEIEIRWGEQA
jgi:hypothetical protein